MEQLKYGWPKIKKCDILRMVKEYSKPKDTNRWGITVKLIIKDNTPFNKNFTNTIRKCMHVYKT